LSVPTRKRQLEVGSAQARNSWRRSGVGVAGARSVEDRAGMGTGGQRGDNVVARDAQIVQLFMIEVQQGRQRCPTGTSGLRLGDPAREGDKWIGGRGGRK